MDYSDTTVIIPVKNEPAVGKVAREVMAKLPNCSVIVIYKGQQPGGRLHGNDVLVLKQKERGGKGAACIEAARYVKTDIMCFIDGDDTYTASDLGKVVAKVRGGYDMALGNRFGKGEIDQRAMPGYVALGNRILTAAVNVVYGTRIWDSQTGLRAMRRKAFEKMGITDRHFGIEEETVIKAARIGYRITEVPIGYRERVGTTKQFKPVDGVKLLLTVFRFILWSPDR